MCFDLSKMMMPIEDRSVALGTCGTVLILSLLANNVRTAGQIRMGEAPIDVFRPRKDDGA